MGNMSDEDNIEKFDALKRHDEKRHNEKHHDEKRHDEKRHDEKRHNEKRHSRRKIKNERESKNGCKKCDTALKSEKEKEEMKVESENDCQIQMSDKNCDDESKSQCSDVVKDIHDVVKGECGDITGECDVIKGKCDVIKGKCDVIKDECAVGNCKLDDVVRCDVGDAEVEMSDGENCQEIDRFVVANEMSSTNELSSSKRCKPSRISSQDSKQVNKNVFVF